MSTWPASIVISRAIYANAAGAIVGMVRNREAAQATSGQERPLH
ncbi:hypothetical protein [Achromobacter marplatensis]